MGYRAPYGAYNLRRERIKKSGIIGRVSMHDDDDDDQNDDENYNENDDIDN